MQYVDERSQLRVEIEAKGCRRSAEELAQVQRILEPLGESVRGLGETVLTLQAVYHPHNNIYHVEARLRLPARSLVSSQEEVTVDAACQLCVGDLVQQAGLYWQESPSPDGRRHREALLDTELVAPEDPADGPLGQAVRNGDYRAFRLALGSYEEWLRKRVGRWVQRYPDVEARVGPRLRLGDLVEEVYLNAFEGCARRPAAVPFHQWLEGLIDPSLKALLRHPDLESENASMARTVRDLPPTKRGGPMAQRQP